jgi:replication-associated recombination protein RarA
MSDVRTESSVRNAPTKLMKELGYHKGYEMYSKGSYLLEKLKNKQYLSGSKDLDKN